MQGIVAYTLRNIFAKNEVNWTIFANVVTFSVEVYVPKKKRKKLKMRFFWPKKSQFFRFFRFFSKINRNHLNT